MSLINFVLLNQFLAATTENLTVSTVNGLLGELVKVTSRNDDLFGGDLEVLMSILSVTVSRSESILLPKITDQSTAVALTINITQVQLFTSMCRLNVALKNSSLTGNYLFMF